MQRWLFGGLIFVSSLLLVGSMVGVLAGAWAWIEVERAKKEVQSGWTLKPVVVTSLDVPAETILDFAHIQQRRVPEGMITPSVVLPESVNHVVQQVIFEDRPAGSILRWTSFDLDPKEGYCGDLLSGRERPPFTGRGPCDEGEVRAGRIEDGVAHLECRGADGEVGRKASWQVGS
ncbi:MAG: hypothetical protein P1V51_04990 [Deltaproteobacteria bacterium]|nr:hypothetical protein [Deltaproteobacteria bacterium]